MTQRPSEHAVTENESSTGEESLQRGLSYRHIQLIAIGGAIGTGLFLGSAKTISLTGPSIVFVYAIIGVIIYFVLRAMGEILLSNPKYKSFTDFVSDILGARAGFFRRLVVLVLLGDHGYCGCAGDYGLHALLVSRTSLVYSRAYRNRGAAGSKPALGEEFR